MSLEVTHVKLVCDICDRGPVVGNVKHLSKKGWSFEWGESEPLVKVFVSCPECLKAIRKDKHENQS